MSLPTPDRRPVPAAFERPLQDMLDMRDCMKQLFKRMRATIAEGIEIDRRRVLARHRVQSKKRRIYDYRQTIQQLEEDIRHDQDWLCGLRESRPRRGVTQKPDTISVSPLARFLPRSSTPCPCPVPKVLT